MTAVSIILWIILLVITNSATQTVGFLPDKLGRNRTLPEVSGNWTANQKSINNPSIQNMQPAIYDNGTCPGIWCEYDHKSDYISKTPLNYATVNDTKPTDDLLPVAYTFWKNPLNIIMLITVIVGIVSNVATVITLVQNGSDFSNYSSFDTVLPPVFG